MAMTISTDGIEELGTMLAKLEGKAYDVASEALYDGAGIVGNAFTAAINRIHAEPQGKKNKKPMKTPKRWPTPEEKAALQGKSGIARFNKDGDGVDTLIGISGASGYANVNGKPKAVRLIARSINSGTSFMKKQPVFRRAKTASQSAAKNAIVSKAEEMLDQIING